VINVTLPDEKSNYVHRIGRVGRAERMGLAISLVSSVPEKVWYHGEWCSSRGRNCFNTNLTDQGGCCTWYNEPNVSFERDLRSIENEILYLTNNKPIDFSVVLGGNRGSLERDDSTSRIGHKSAAERVRRESNIRRKENGDG